MTICDPATGERVDDGTADDRSGSAARKSATATGSARPTSEIFPGRGLRTGDLGALWQGELYVTDQLKDLLIVRGRITTRKTSNRRWSPPSRNCSRAAWRICVSADSGDPLVLIEEVAANNGLSRASRPLPIHRLSSRPTRTWPPSTAACRGDRHLVPAGADHRPLIVVAEQPIGGALHVQHVFRDACRCRRGCRTPTE